MKQAKQMESTNKWKVNENALLLFFNEIFCSYRFRAFQSNWRASFNVPCMSCFISVNRPLTTFVVHVTVLIYALSIARDQISINSLQIDENNIKFKTETFHNILLIFAYTFFFDFSLVDFILDWWYPMEMEKMTELVKRYRCECGSSYTHNSSLRFHKRWECGKLPSFECPICNYMFKRKSNMMKHIQMVHGRNQHWDILHPQSSALSTNGYFEIPSKINETHEYSHFQCISKGWLLFRQISRVFWGFFRKPNQTSAHHTGRLYHTAYQLLIYYFHILFFDNFDKKSRTNCSIKTFKMLITYIFVPSFCSLLYVMYSSLLFERRFSFLFICSIEKSHRHRSLILLSLFMYRIYHLFLRLI